MNTANDSGVSLDTANDEELFGPEPEEPYPCYLAALELAKAPYRFRVMPVCGKNPVMQKWPTEAPTDPDKITQLFRDFHRATNVGIVTGGDFFVLDVDPKHGGFESLADLEAKYQKLPITLTAITGSGGHHYYFKKPAQHKGRIVTATAVLGGGLDIRGDANGFVVAPPSIHPDTGKTYEWRNYNASIVTAPDWLMKALAEGEHRHRQNCKNFRSKALKLDRKLTKSELTPYLVRLSGFVKGTFGYDGDDLVREVLRYARAAAEDPEYYSEEYVQLKCRWALGREFERDDDAIAIRENEDGSLVQVKAGVEIGQPLVIITDQQTRTIAEALMKAVVARNEPPVVFHQGGRLVRIDVEGKTAGVGVDGLTGYMDRASIILKKKGTGEAPARLDSGAAKYVLSGDLATCGLPELKGVIHTPMLLADGRVLDTPGYDAGSGYYLALPDGFEVHARPEPSQEAAKAAYESIFELLKDFPFEDESSKTNAMAFILGTAARNIIDAVAPLALVVARKAGTGKTLLCKAVAALATGVPVNLLTLPYENEETKKLLVSHFLNNPAATIFDNATNVKAERLNQGVLNAALTCGMFSARILGKSETMTYNLCGHLMMLNGNNLDVGGELARRSVLIGLDAKISDPTKRVPLGGFHPEGDALVSWCVEQQPEITAKLLTILESWIDGGMPTCQGGVVLASFEQWSRAVGDILHFCGAGAFLRNQAKLKEEFSNEDDEDYNFILAIQGKFGNEAWKVKELAAVVAGGGVFAESLPTYIRQALEMRRDALTALTYYLRARKDQRFGSENLWLRHNPKNGQGYRAWQIVK